MARKLRGQSLNRSEACKFFDKAPTVIDQFVREGMPYVKKPIKGVGGWEFDSAEIAQWLMDRAAIKNSGGEDVKKLDIDEHRKRKTSAEASIAEIQLRKLLDEVIEFSVVEQAGIESYSACRAKLLNIPPRLAARLLSCSRAEEVEALLYMEINKALAVLGDYTEVGNDVAGNTEEEIDQGVA